MGTLFVGLIVLQLQQRLHTVSGRIKNPERAAAAAVETVEVVPGARRKTDSSCQRER